MKACFLAIVACLTLAPSARAQQLANDGSMSAYLRRSYAAAARNLIAVAEMMPEQDFEFRPPGVASEVRTFAEIVHHTAAVTSWVCSMGVGKPDPVPAKPIRDKKGLLALLNDTNARCTEYLATLTDSALTQVTVTGTPPNQLQAGRGNAVIFAIAHLNEHYGNLVTYLRVKGLVPPPAAAQVAPLSRVPPK